MNALATSMQPAVDAPAGEAYCFGDLRVLAGIDLLYKGNEVVPLEPRAVQVLRHLVRHAGRVVPKEELLDVVWPDAYVTDGVLKKAVSQVRRALDDPPQRSRFIETFHRRGYRFVAPVMVTRDVAGPRPAAVRSAPASPICEELDFDRLAGRGAEIEALRTEYRRALARRGTPLLVLGEAGIGKTQLSRHFQRWASQQEARCLFTRFSDYAGSRLAPGEVFLDLLRTAVGPIRPGSLREALAERFGVELPVELFEAPDGAAPRAVSTPEAEELSRRAAGAIAACFVALCREEQPLVLQLDDLQWADTPGLAVVSRLLVAAREEPLLLVAYARPAAGQAPGQGKEPFAGWLAALPDGRGFSSLLLEGLPEAGVREALSAILGCGPDEPEIAAEDLRRLHRLTGGNPYFLSELLRGLVAEGVLYRDGPAGAWRCGRLAGLRLPTTLATAAQARLAALDPDLRALLESAAVIGDELRVPTLTRVAGRPVVDVEALLGRALHAGALSTAQVSPGEDCRFRHTLVREVLYDGLSPWRRRELHQRTAAALEEVYAAELDRVTEALAAHWRAAGDLRRAFSRELRAAEAALGRWQWRDALAGAERAREDLASLQRTGAALPEAAERIALRTALGQSLAALGRAQEAEAALEAAAEEAGDAGDPRVLATVFFHLAAARVAQGRQAEARAASERALALFTAQGETRGRALAVAQLAGIRIAMGEYVAAAGTLGEELERLHLQPAHTARLAAVIGWAHALQGSFAEAVRLLGIAVADRRAAADPRGLASVLGRLQWAHLGRGEHRRALALVAEARACFAAAGDALGQARMEMSRGQILTARGLAVQGVEPLRRSAEALRAAGDVHCEAEALWLLGQALTELGRLDEACPLLTTALARVREVPDRDDEFRVSIDLARLRRLNRRPAEALELAAQGYEIAAALGCHDGEGRALAERAGARRALGQAQEALADAEEAVAILERCGSGETWRALHELALAQEPWQPALAVATLERAAALLAAVRADLDEADRPAFDEVRRPPFADLERLHGHRTVTSP